MFYDLWRIIWFENLLAVIGIHIMLTRVSTGVIRRKTAAALCVTLLLPSMAGTLFPLTRFGRVAVPLYMLLPFVLPLFTVANVKKRTVLYITFLYIGISGIVTLPFNLIASALNLGEPVRIIADAAANCLLLLTCVLMGKKIILKNLYCDFGVLDTRIKVFLVISVWIGTTFAQFFADAFGARPQTSLELFTGVLAYALVLLIFVMCPLLTACSVSNSNNKTLFVTIEKQMKAQAAHFKMTTQINDDIREFKHNLHNVKIGLLNFLSNNDLDGALAYINELTGYVHDDVGVFETGNPVVDALLYEKQIMAAENGTVIKFDGLIPGDRMSPADLCVIIGNAVDNAMEACEDLCGEIPRLVSVTTSFTNGFLFIRVENPVAEDVRIVNNTLATTKDDKAAHGIGLTSIQNAVNRNSGHMQLSCKKQVFVLEVDLDLNMVGL